MSGYYCSNCGQALAVGAGFCGKCGTAASQRAQDGLPRATQSYYVVPPVPQRPAIPNPYDYRLPQGYGRRPDREISGLGWMIEPLRRYADFTGRSRRMEYWMFTLLWWAITIAAFAMIIAGMPSADAIQDHSYAVRQGMDTGPAPAAAMVTWVGVSLWILWWLVAFVPSCALIVRRLHDSDKSGWLLALFLGLNMILGFFGWFVQAIFMFLDGTRGSNKYGVDPKNEMPGDIFR